LIPYDLGTLGEYNPMTNKMDFLPNELVLREYDDDVAPRQKPTNPHFSGTFTDEDINEWYTDMLADLGSK